MNEQENMDCPLVDIVRTLKDIPDRGEPCDREIADDGTQVILNGDMGNEPHYG